MTNGTSCSQSRSLCHSLYPCLHTQPLYKHITNIFLCHYSISSISFLYTIVGDFMSVLKLEATLITKIVKIVKPYVKSATTKRAFFRKNQHDILIWSSSRPSNLCVLWISNTFIPTCLPDIIR